MKCQIAIAAVAVVLLVAVTLLLSSHLSEKKSGSAYGVLRCEIRGVFFDDLPTNATVEIEGGRRVKGCITKECTDLTVIATRSTSLRLSTKADAERIAVMEFQIREIESLLDKIHIYEFSKRVKVAMVLKWIKCGRSFECFL